MPRHPRPEGEHALKRADLAARQGDLRAAERWTRTAERMATAARQLAETPPPPDAGADAEALRAELRERFRRLAECDIGLEAWARERELHERLCAEARAAGRPMPPPLPPAPFTEADMEKIAKGES